MFVATLTFASILFGSFSFADTPNLTLSSNSAELQWTADGLSIHNTNGEGLTVLGSPKPVWALRLLESPAKEGYTGKEVIVEDLYQTLEQKRIENGWELYYPSLVVGNQKFDISFKLTITVVNSAFHIAGQVDNKTADWVVQEVVGPVVNRIEATLSETPILWPSGLGRIISVEPDRQKDVLTERSWATGGWVKSADQYSIHSPYPCHQFTMQWFAFAGPKFGLYIGCNDPTRQAKRFDLFYNIAEKTWKATVVQMVCIAPNTKWEQTLVDIYPYQGDWHAAADFYRAQVDSWTDKLPLASNPAGNGPYTGACLQKPNWVSDIAGMYLVILKQQNGRHKMWRYEDIGGKISDCADEQGFDFLALFGWHHGGHDHLYPDMLPDPEMGGRDALVKGIAAAHARNKRVYLYANGQLIDRDNQKFWTTEGEKLTIQFKDGSLQHEVWTKFTDSPGHYCGRACSGAPRWFEIMLGLAKQANEFGADGILFDQLAVGGPSLCFSPNHGHAVPAMGHGTQAAYLIEKIQREMNKINPDFIVLTEGFNDASVAGSSYYHGVSYGLYGIPDRGRVLAQMNRAPGDYSFRSMFKYTFPEVDVTIRNPFPLEHPRCANLACCYGLNHEIELRYPADVTCVKTRQLPDPEEYKAGMMTGVGAVIGDTNQIAGDGYSAQNCLDYSRRMIAFQKAHRELLLSGKFVDNKNFKAVGAVVATAFVSNDGQKLGVIVWNPDVKPVSVQVQPADGFAAAKFAGAFAPGTKSDEPVSVTNVNSELNPESVRLYVWEK